MRNDTLLRAITFSGVALALAACETAPAQQAAAPATPPAPVLQANASIPFLNHGGVEDWRAEGSTALLVKSRTGHYYRATFMSPCRNLPYAVGIGFKSDGTDTLDKFDSVEVRGERCVFVAFDEIPKPDKW